MAAASHIIVCLLVLVSKASGRLLETPEVDCGAVTEVDTGGFFRLLVELETQGIMQKLQSSLRVVPYEILTAASTGTLTALLDTLDHVTLLRLLDDLTESYSHRFISYLVSHLDAENCTTTPDSTSPVRL